jgi:DNA-binding transcriptional LysR family regulator
VDLSHLEVLVAIAQEKGFSRAAERLGRTQPAISQSIRRLEQDVDAVLFDRSSKDGTLTEAGRVLYGYAQQLLAMRREAHGAIQELATLVRGKVAAAANEYTVAYLLPVVKEFRRHHPEIRVEIQRSLASRIPAEILGREAEVGVVSYRPAQPGLTAVPIARDELALLVAPGHRLARRSQVSIRDLGREPFLAHNVRTPYRERVVQTFARHRVPLDIVIELPTLESVRRLVEQGLGVALMPRRAAHAEIARGDVVALSVREMRLERTIHLVYRSGGVLSHAASAFVALAEGMASRAERS